jgi:predicted transposase YdaD
MSPAPSSDVLVGMTPTPHDALVRAILGQPCHAAEELRILLPPEVRAELRLDTLTPVDGAFIDAALDESNADLLFSVALREGSGRRAYILLEHQSTPDPAMAWRLLGYQAGIWERHRADHPGESTVPPILVALLHHGPRPWPGAPRFSEIVALQEPARTALGRRVLDF